MINWLEPQYIFITTKQLFYFDGTALLQMQTVINRLLRPKVDICDWLQVTVVAFHLSRLWFISFQIDAQFLHRLKSAP